jgi:RHS repeat-associated protein
MRQIKYFRLLLLTGLLVLSAFTGAMGQLWNPNHAIGTLTGQYQFSYNQTPDQLVELFPAGVNMGFTYQWEQSSMPVSGFTAISGATGVHYSITGPLTQTTYYRRKTTNNVSLFIYSNTIKIQVVSVNWEDRNYVREHSVRTTGITSWTSVDQLPIGEKLQTTTYLDGLGRPIEKVGREMATPAISGGLWGDVVQFYEYDALGREPLKYLSYTTTTQSGKYKTIPATEQAQYYNNVYNETSAFSTITFENSPLNRILNAKKPGTSWAAGQGTSAEYETNSVADNVQIFDVDYIPGNAPVHNGAYPANTLYKSTYTDENGHKIIEYSDKEGKLILKKVQIDNSPTLAHTGWLCTYHIYDDFGSLRFQLQPEAVKYLDANSWSFAGVNGQQVLNEQCFQYNYDDRGNMIWKKVPGAAPLQMIYDIRDRLVFMQDGNQAALSTPQWTFKLFDELDRPVVSGLYNTGLLPSQLQSAINSAATISNIVISNPANTGGSNITLSTSLNPVSASNLNNTSSTTVLQYFFYDSYVFPLVKSFNTGYNNLSAYNTPTPNVMPIAVTNRNSGRITGNLARVLGGNTFLATTLYYDKDGNLQQILKDNIKSGTDIKTFQYHFDGLLLSTCSDHTTSGTGYTNFKTLTKLIADKIGRIASIDKQVGANPFKTIAGYEYDDVGRLKTLHLDPMYNGSSPLESLNYSFNIHDQLTGINKDYALKNPASYNKWGHFFGIYLGYDNRDNVFSQPQLNGQLTGVIWNTQGDDAQRKYEYNYDKARRLINAAFTEQQHAGDGWSNSLMDFSVTGSSGQITYDLNGNLLNMLQKGVMPGNATPITIDNLSYTYASFSNKLQGVTDQMTATTVNGQSGDFKDGVNSTPDYVYDANGNVVIDLNKNVQSLNGGAPGTPGIRYNFLDKPELIRIGGKGTVRIIYSASGEKLQRAFIPEAGGAAAITTYIDDFIYQETAVVTTTSTAPLGGVASLTHINFEEGRIRIITPVSQTNGYDALTLSGNITLPNGKSGVYDYFIKDYQENVRMILTEETHSASNMATMEIGRASAEEPVFGQTGGSNEVATTRSPVPGGWSNGSIGSSVSRLGNIAGFNIGPNTLQKVMAGDQVSATVQYYYQSATGGDNPNLVSTLLSSLGQAIMGSNATGSLVKGNVTGVTSQLGAATGFVSAVKPAGSGGTTPQAYLTILFFDERFKFIEAADGGVAQQQVASSVGSAGATLGLMNIKAPKNGYVYVYVSNRSDQHVYFDNLQAGITRGNIIEENHYYAYGLKIAAISSRKAGDVNEGKLNNYYLYNGKEIDEEADLGWYDYGFRNYDPQTGRFVQIDPLTDDYPLLSPYQYATCDPVNNIDVDGLFTEIATTAGAIKTLQEVVVVGYRATKTATSLINIAINVTSVTIKVAVAAIDIINSSTSTVQVGQQTNPPTKEWTVDAFIKKWEADHGTTMTTKQKETLARGCIGVTALELGDNLGPRGRPPHTHSYSTLDRAQKEAKRLEQDIKKNPDKYPKNARVIIWSTRFWTNDASKFLPDKNGKVDMSSWDASARPADASGGYTNFDYGLLDKKTGKWWHANHKDPGMIIYESTLSHYSRTLKDFNRQVFSAQITVVPLK